MQYMLNHTRPRLRGKTKVLRGDRVTLYTSITNRKLRGKVTHPSWIEDGRIYVVFVLTSSASGCKGTLGKASWDFDLRCWIACWWPDQRPYVFVRDSKPKKYKV